MSERRDPDRLIHRFLSEGSEQLHDQVYDAVRAQIEHQRQRAVFGPWRMPDMNKFTPIGLGIAAVVVVLVVGSQFLAAPAPGGVGGGPGPTASPSPTPEPSVAAPSPSDASVPERTFALTTTTAPLPGGIATTVTIAAPGWSGAPGDGILVKDSAGMIGPWHEPLYVYGDPCRWSTTTPATPATTVDDIVAALASQASRDASAPVDVTLDGYEGKMITLHVPEDLVAPLEGTFTDCDEDKFASWGTDSEPGPARYQQFPGQVDEVWIVDIDGQAAVIDASYSADTPAETVAEMRAIIESIDFQP
ncbi:MAG: hypothetical protein ACSLFN_00610 [Candidatus Limnocylindrales bacterium]